MFTQQDGSSFIPVLISVGIISLMILAAFPLIEQQQKFAAQVNTSISLSVARSTMNAVIQNPVAWASIKNDDTCNTTLKCVKDGTDCATQLPDIGAEYPINCIYDATGSNLMVNTQNPDGGFDLSGKPCVPSASGSGSADTGCLIKPRITWKLMCTAAPCVGSAIQVNVAFDIKTERHLNLNTARFALSVIR